MVMYTNQTIRFEEWSIFDKTYDIFYDKYSLNIIYFLKENCKIFKGSNIIDLTIFFLYNYINIIFTLEHT